MSFLPPIDQPIFSTTLPVSNRPVKFRPFLVKEEKILLVAEHSKETKDVVAAIKQVLKNCVVSDTNIDDLPLFEIEYLFIQLSAKSVGNIRTFQIQDSEDEQIVDLEVDLDDVQIFFPEGHTNIVQLDTTKTMTLRYPSILEMNDLLKFDPQNEEDVTKLVALCIDTIYDEDNIYPVKDVSQEELCAYIDSFPITANQQVEKFFSTMPRIRHVIKYKNSLDNEREFIMEGLEDFFT